MLIDDSFAQQMRADGEQKGVSTYMWAMRLCVARSSKTKDPQNPWQTKRRGPWEWTLEQRY